MPIAAPQPELGNVTGGSIVSPAVSIELKMDSEMKSLLDRIPENMVDRLAEVERVLGEICGREGIAFNIEHPDRKRVLRNVKDK